MCSSIAARALLGALALGALPWIAACGSRGSEAPRNLLLISLDTLRADALGIHGSERGASPHLDAFAARSVVFERAFSHSPKTAPSHHSLFTSLEPRVHGVGNLDTASASSLPPEAVPLAETLAARGFRTAAYTGGGNIKALLGFDRGFEIYEDGPGTLVGKLEQSARWVERVGALDGVRWFLFFHTYYIHDPYLVPAELAQRFTDPNYAGRILGVRRDLMARIQGGEDLAPQRGGSENVTANFWLRVDESDPRDWAHLHDLYIAGVAEADQRVGAFLQRLERAGHLEDTVVVITSDHGEEFGEHGRLRHDQLWQEILHVPLIVRLPGDAHGGTRISTPVAHIDFAPSMLELLDVADTTLLRRGQSWAAWLARPQRAPQDRLLFAEHRSRRERPLDTFAVRSGGWLLLSDTEGEHVRDLRADPLELHPLSDSERAAALRGIAEEQIAAQDALANTLSAPGDVVIDAATRAELEALGYF